MRKLPLIHKTILLPSNQAVRILMSVSWRRISSLRKMGRHTVKRILTDEVYLGYMVQGKTEKVNYKVKKHIAKPEEEWMKVENTHEIKLA